MGKGEPRGRSVGRRGLMPECRLDCQCLEHCWKLSSQMAGANCRFHRCGRSGPGCLPYSSQTCLRTLDGEVIGGDTRPGRTRSLVEVDGRVGLRVDEAGEFVAGTTIPDQTRSLLHALNAGRQHDCAHYDACPAEGLWQAAAPNSGGRMVKVSSQPARKASCQK